MDGFSFHPYPNEATDPLERGYAWPNASFANLDRLKQALWDAFRTAAQPTTLEGLTLHLDEVGWQVDTSGRPGYRGLENVPVTDEATQAAIYGQLISEAAGDLDVASSASSGTATTGCGRASRPVSRAPTGRRDLRRPRCRRRSPSTGAPRNCGRLPAPRCWEPRSPSAVAVTRSWTRRSRRGRARGCAFVPPTPSSRVGGAVRSRSPGCARYTWPFARRLGQRVEVTVQFAAEANAKRRTVVVRQALLER